jgi:hypothetical protein
LVGNEALATHTQCWLTISREQLPFLRESWNCRAAHSKTPRNLSLLLSEFTQGLMLIRQSARILLGISIAHSIENQWHYANTSGARTMAKDERDILELLKTELDFIEKGGYGRSVRTPWQPTSSFRDSLTCVNYALPEKAHACTECHLIEFVPRDKQDEELPCHFIPLNATGDTVEQLDGNETKLQEALKEWMREKIREIEAQRQQE